MRGKPGPVRVELWRQDRMVAAAILQSLDEARALEARWVTERLARGLPAGATITKAYTKTGDKPWLKPN